VRTSADADAVLAPAVESERDHRLVEERARLVVIAAMAAPGARFDEMNA